jgi:hypothetical protein
VKRTRILLATVVFAVAAGWLYGSITLDGAGSTLIAPPALRQGDYQSPDVVVPTTGISTVMVAFDGIPTADYENPINSFDFKIEMSKDGSTGWIPTAGFQFQSPGGPFVDPKTGVVDPVNSVTFDIRPWTGQGYLHLRAHVTIPNPMTAGVTVTLQ